MKISKKQNGRVGVDYLIGDNQIHLKSIYLDTTQRSIKILKEELGELKDNLFIALILILDNEVSLVPSLSNWEIKISTNAIPELSKYALDNMIDILKR
ncbi:hypothetical protein [Tenacibaculum ovolyticum]|uniref:hypothetical protein n=1 Tax=Tenacibaculum ovolyticum TaxID=104270 RepID=UPI000413B815|nr:hypothetical protein [Tenacibaculum ovolyticum]